MAHTTYHKKRTSNWIAIRVKGDGDEIRTYELDDYGRLKVPFPRQKKRVLKCTKNKPKKLPRKARLISFEEVGKENDLEPTATQDVGFFEQTEDIADISLSPEVLALFEKNLQEEQTEQGENPYFPFPGDNWDAFLGQ